MGCAWKWLKINSLSPTKEKQSTCLFKESHLVHNSNITAGGGGGCSHEHVLLWQNSDQVNRSKRQSWSQTNMLNLFSQERRKRSWEGEACGLPSPHLLILSWPSSPKPHASQSVNSGLDFLILPRSLLRLRILLKSSIGLFPKRDWAPCAAKTGMEGLASPKQPSGGLRLSLACLVPRVSSPEEWQKKLLGELTYPFFSLFYLSCTVLSLSSLSVSIKAHPLCLCASVAGSSQRQ